MPAFSKKMGQELLETARKTVIAAFSNINYRLNPETMKRYSAETGVFVNIYNRRNELRGSFGFPQGTMPLSDGIKQASRGAAFKDPRFAALTKAELSRVKFEVVLLKPLKLLKVKKGADYFKKITPKKHGLFISRGPFSAMQLPLFAVKRKLSARDYLEKTIEKSGLAPESWQDLHLRVYVFETTVFKEM